MYGLGNLSRLSFASMSSVRTYIPSTGVLHLALDQLCGRIGEHRSMQRAEVLRSCTFVEKKLIAPHRCLVLELRRAGRKCIWLRLERKPTSFNALASGKGRTPSNDIVRVVVTGNQTPSLTWVCIFLKCSLAADSAEIVEKARYKLDNEQIFPDSPPTLGDLNHLLRVIQEELTEYTFWSVSTWPRGQDAGRVLTCSLQENCWMFCSFLQERLGWGGAGKWVLGASQHEKFGAEVRRRIRARVRRIWHMPESPTVRLDSTLIPSALRLILFRPFSF